MPDERWRTELGLVTVLGVNIRNCSKRDAVLEMEAMITQRPRRSSAIYIVNAHTLNLATEDPEYKSVLNNADVVFGDGTGVRWAARSRGVTMQDNLVGTDLIPQLFQETAGKGYGYFLLGGDEATIERAAASAAQQFPGWRCAGFHHGYIDDPGLTASVVEKVNASSADVLLVGMGNPKQEKWIDAHLAELQVPVCVGVGGLFDHWAGNLRRAGGWVRAHGFEWLQLLFQQPSKARRYLIGNPLFLWRIARLRRDDLSQALAAPDTLTTTTNSQVRWLCKKGARQAVALGSHTMAPLTAAATAPGVRVLTYHRFGTAIRDPFCVAARDFEAQMKYLAENDLAISLDQLLEFLAGRQSLPQTRVLVTIDDGLQSLHSVALPILREFSIPAAAFVSPGLLSAAGPTVTAAEPYMNWEQIGELAQANIAIGSHALTHRSLGRLSASEVENEVRQSKEIIEQQLGTTASSFAYPFGTYADFNDLTASSLRDAGYLCAFTSQHGAIHASENPFALPRVKVEGGENLRMFQRIVGGGLDAWRAVDRTLWRLQARGQ